MGCRDLVIQGCSIFPGQNSIVAVDDENGYAKNGGDGGDIRRQGDAEEDAGCFSFPASASTAYHASTT